MVKQSQDVLPQRFSRTEQGKGYRIFVDKMVDHLEHIEGQNL